MCPWTFLVLVYSEMPLKMNMPSTNSFNWKSNLYMPVVGLQRECSKGTCETLNKYIKWSCGPFLQRLKYQCIITDADSSSKPVWLCYF